MRSNVPTSNINHLSLTVFPFIHVVFAVFYLIEVFASICMSLYASRRVSVLPVLCFFFFRSEKFSCKISICSCSFKAIFLVWFLVNLVGNLGVVNRCHFVLLTKHNSRSRINLEIFLQFSFILYCINKCFDIQ